MTSIEFPTLVQERLGYYVYVLIDPRVNRPFYVGKGKGTLENFIKSGSQNPVKYTF
jgi:hypothetical protein